MNFKQEISSQKEQKSQRTALIEETECFPEDSTALPQKDLLSTSSSEKKVCLPQIIDQAPSGIHSNRTLLEILKLCSPTDVLRSLSLVNRHWAETCSSNEMSKELWDSFLEDLCIPPDTFTHPKATCADYTRQQQTVVDLSSDRMEVLNKLTGVWMSTMLSTRLQERDYSYAVLFDGSLLCCGGRNFIKRRDGNGTYKITVDGEVSSSEPMVTGRFSHGIASYGRKVFVFGGFDGFGTSLLTIEQYDETSWSELPAKLNVHHASFVPSLYKGQIYLCDSFARPMEVFNPKSLTVAILTTITIPDDFCFAVTGYDGCILAIGSSKVWKWNCETNDSEEIQKPNYYLWGMRKRNVLHGDVLYIIKNPHPLMVNIKTFSRKYFKNLPRQLTR